MHIAGVGFARPSRPDDLSLEELVFTAARAALDDAGMSRDDLDGTCLAGSDQFDGRAISSMQLAGPAGSYLLDEVKVADDGALTLAAAALRIEAGVSSSLLLVSWTKPSVSDPDTAVGVNPEPTFRRPTAQHPWVAEAVATRAAVDRYGMPLDAVDELAQRLSGGAAADDRELVTPIRTSHVPPPTEGAVALVVTAEPAPVRVAGLAWGADHPDPLARNGGPLGSLPVITEEACRRAGVTLTPEVPVETTDRTAFRLCLSVGGLGLAAPAEAAAALLDGRLPRVNTSGGLWVSNPILAAGLERIAEGVLQVRQGAEVVVAHSSYGYGGQGNAVAVLSRN